jgi:hypothetical protein
MISPNIGIKSFLFSDISQKPSAQVRTKYAALSIKIVFFYAEVNHRLYSFTLDPLH